MRFSVAVFGLAVMSVGVARGGEDASAPRPVPLTRPEMKLFLEDMKVRKPRIPLPELTEEEKAKLGERGGGYEGRLRSLYLLTDDSRNAPPAPAPSAPGAGTRQGGGPMNGFGFSGFGFGRDQDPKMTLDYAFKTELFWIVSRTNNCQYCLGHQESKLLSAGLKEEEIAALDGDWSEFTPAQRAAFAFARKITFEPNAMTDADINNLRKHYTDLQILEMILSVSGNNAINRWKEGVGVPQSSNGGGFGNRPENANAAAPAPAPARPAAGVAHSYLTPTPEKFQKVVTRVAPFLDDDKTAGLTRPTVCRRPPMESRAEVEKALEACRERSPRLPLVPEAEARAIVSGSWPEGSLPQFVRLLANFPRDGVRLIEGIRANEDKTDLKPLLKAQVSWIIARQDRAWYAAGRAARRLQELGQSADQIDSLDGDWAAFAPADRALFNVARKLAASPVVLTDEDVAQAVKLAGPRDVVRLVNYTTHRAAFDRITEAAGLQLEK